MTFEAGWSAAPIHSSSSNQRDSDEPCSVFNSWQHGGMTQEEGWSTASPTRSNNQSDFDALFSVFDSWQENGMALEEAWSTAPLETWPGVTVIKLEGMDPRVVSLNLGNSKQRGGT